MYFVSYPFLQSLLALIIRTAWFKNTPHNKRVPNNRLGQCSCYLSDLTAPGVGGVWSRAVIGLLWCPTTSACIKQKNWAAGFYSSFHPWPLLFRWVRSSFHSFSASLKARLQNLMENPLRVTSRKELKMFKLIGIYKWSTLSFNKIKWKLVQKLIILGDKSKVSANWI